MINPVSSPDKKSSRPGGWQQSVGAVLLLLLSACSNLPLQSTAILNNPPGAYLQPIELSNTAFFSQKEFQCGPAALATLLHEQNIAIKPATLVDKVYVPSLKGSLQVEMLATARQYQLIPYVLDKNITSLLTEIKAGNPVLVLQNLGLDWAPSWHYAVVIGYNLQENQIILRSGTIKRHVNSFELFERTWRRSKYWAMLALPASRIPASAKAHPYLQAIHSQEKLGRITLANTAYRAAKQRWPNNKQVLMALGNNYYALDKKQWALKTFRTITEKWPDYSPALNNVAHLLLEQKRYRQARAYARRAIQHGRRRHQQQYEKTLARIQAKLEN